MSLTGWVNYDSDFIDTIALFAGMGVDSLPRLERNNLSAPPVTNHYALVGTAFDYAMRAWLSALCGISALSCDVVSGAVVPRRIVADYGATTSKRKRLVSSFCTTVSSLSPGRALPDNLLEQCIVLANLDSVYRRGLPITDTEAFSVDRGDVNDLRMLMSLVGRNTDRWKTVRFLNPCFGSSSSFVGGADADFVVGDALVDMKTTKYLSLRPEYIRQLLGYYILNLRELNPYHIRRLGIYFSRYGYLYTFVVPGGEMLEGDNKGRVGPLTWSIANVWDDIESSMESYREECGLP